MGRGANQKSNRREVAQAREGVRERSGQPLADRNRPDASRLRGFGTPHDTANPTNPRTLSHRAAAALAFIAVANQQGIFPHGGDVRRFLLLKHVRQGARVIEELIRARHICRTKRGLELAGSHHIAPALSFWGEP